MLNFFLLGENFQIFSEIGFLFRLIRVDSRLFAVALCVHCFKKRNPVVVEHIHCEEHSLEAFPASPPRAGLFDVYLYASNPRRANALAR